MCGIIKPEAWNLVEWSLLCTAFECGREIELRRALEGLPSSLARFDLGILVNILPFGSCVWPYQQPEPLNESITTDTTRVSSSYIFANACRLSPADDRKTYSFKGDVATPDSVETVRLLSVPAGKEESSRDDLFLAIRCFRRDISSSRSMSMPDGLFRSSSPRAS